MNAAEMQQFLIQNPVIAAVKTVSGLQAALQSDVRVVFILCANILNLEELVTAVRRSGKRVFLHLDLLEGFVQKEIAVDYIVRRARPDGIISTKQSLLKYAHRQELLTIQRFFLLDSMSLDALRKDADGGCADFIEVLPGVARTVERAHAINRTPLIASGLIESKADVCDALRAGAIAVSGTEKGLWDL